jgi:hypothetical protein
MTFVYHVDKGAWTGVVGSSMFGKYVVTNAPNANLEPRVGLLARLRNSGMSEGKIQTMLREDGSWKHLRKGKKLCINREFMIDRYLQKHSYSLTSFLHP